jgi:AcrR family transcriptional regulator
LKAVQTKKVSTRMPLRKRRGRPPCDRAQLAIEHATARDAICEAALNIFAEGGAEAIAMRKVAQVLGVSPMMAYRYFSSKDHLLMELRTRAFEQFTLELRRAHQRAQKPAEKLPLLFAAYLQFAIRNANAYHLMFDMWAFENPKLMKAEFGEKVRRQSDSWREMANVVSDYIAATKSPIDPATATDVVWSALHGAASLHLARKLVFGHSLQELAKPLTKVILAGLTH